MVSKTQIKHIRLLHLKKYRKKWGQFIAEGDKVVCEWIQAGTYTIEQLFALPTWISKRASLLQKLDIPIEEVSPQLLAQMSALQTPQEVLAVINIPAPVHLPPPEQWPNPLVLALESIRDPGNLGTIIRIADWFGIPYICCSPDCAEPYQPKVVQASMGSLARVPIVSSPLIALLDQYPHVEIIAATLQGKPVQQVAMPSQASLLVVGNEAHGLSPNILSRAHQQITIPRIGHAESLNAAIATGILCAFFTLPRNTLIET
ncbi:MAG: RNA methyltransferase [Thermoflavifilum sp.]|nr:RNA methyltransferase [Thermoflavifilum sp.]